MTACDSIGLGHVKICFFGNFGSDVQGGSVGRASVFHAKDMGSNLVLVTFFLHSFLFFLASNSIDSFKLWVQISPWSFFGGGIIFLLSDNSF